jgi:LCP family protein required for cell wall assembly
MKKRYIFSFFLICFIGIVIGITTTIFAKVALMDLFFALTPAQTLFPETNILILGVDGRTGVRSDTIMVLHTDPQNRRASLISIPRDTLAVLPNRGLDKINHAFAYGGLELSKQTVEEFLNIKIPYYVIINLTGIVNLIDEIGGITVNVEKRMYYSDFAGGLFVDLQPGVQKLNGKQAMGYLRFRRDGGDFSRINRQQQFVQALGEELVKKENIWKSPQLFMTLLSNLETNLSARQTVGLSLGLRSIYETGKINMFTIPGIDLMIDGIYYWRPNMEYTRKIINQNFISPQNSTKGRN